jgi:hypothetical protein
LVARYNFGFITEGSGLATLNEALAQEAPAANTHNNEIQIDLTKYARQIRRHDLVFEHFGWRLLQESPEISQEGDARACRRQASSGRETECRGSVFWMDQLTV